ncbi:hypothetical protein H6G74_22605 [Nostoc spongiaeforme FACHB-130]|uniref:Uncharacterized protein n=1 Tax=Nostoc spongiaeforme FACHB-130 TaxID=1357510 RepID=A0ABR8G1H6_9NOSO|nr:hypothetical protein [Nostoc spongiaeforme]MBD2597094.1 hypothetical protein [Nostoc spongiaeforme FACHB-130]
MIPSPTKPWAMFMYPALSLKSKCFTWMDGGLFTSSYAYPGRYPLFPLLRECLSHYSQLLAMTCNQQYNTELFAEEERST